MKTDEENLINKIQGVDTREGKLILDSHKSYLTIMIEMNKSWANGEKKIAPISVDMALTRACGAMCSFAMQWFKSLKKEQALKLKTL